MWTRIKCHIVNEKACDGWSNKIGKLGFLFIRHMCLKHDIVNVSAIEYTVSG